MMIRSALKAALSNIVEIKQYEDSLREKTQLAIKELSLKETIRQIAYRVNGKVMMKSSTIKDPGGK